MLRDERGNEVTAASAEAVAFLDETTRAFTGVRLESRTHLKSMMSADPDLLLGHVFHGYIMMLYCTGEHAAMARQSLSLARASAESRGATERECAHIAALEAWCDGDIDLARRRWGAILVDHPRDALALKVAEYMTFYTGDAEAMLSLITGVLHGWDDSVPGYGFVLGSYCFALEETGDYAAAERCGRRAIDINPADVWATHAVAHVMEMQGRQADGLEWLGSLERHWDGVNNFIYHVWWHRALFHLERGELDAALDLYDTKVRAEPTPEYLDITNAAALLWRLEQEGMDVGHRWGELALNASAHADDHMLVFADTHYAMAWAATGNQLALDDFLRAARRHAERSDTTQARIMRAVGLNVCEAIGAYRRGDFGRFVDLLEPIRCKVWRIGGSRAQRDLFDQMLIHAAMKDGRLALARALLCERTERRPASPCAWNTYADVLDRLGEGPAANGARERAAALIDRPSMNGGGAGGGGLPYAEATIGRAPRSEDM